jgi:transposase
MTGRKLAPICRVLGIGRATVYRAERVRGPRYRKAEDRVVRAHIREVIRTRATYGARRVHALVNRSVGARYNLKRIRRVMALEGWTLPRRARRRTGRAHTGQVQRAVSNERWCSDGLEIAEGDHALLRFYLPREARWAIISGREAFDWPADEQGRSTRPKCSVPRLDETVWEA